MALSLPHEITMNIPWFIHVCPMVSSMFHPHSPWLITFISPTQIPYSKPDEIPSGLMGIKKAHHIPIKPPPKTMGINIISPSWNQLRNISSWNMILITNLYSYDFIMGYDNHGLNPGLRNHRIGWWENSQESPIFDGKNPWVSGEDFPFFTNPMTKSVPLNPIKFH